MQPPRRLFIFAVFFLLVAAAHAQSAAFQKEYYNPTGTLQSLGVDEGAAGYFVGGWVQNGTAMEGFVVHTDTLGNLLWSYRYSDGAAQFMIQAIDATSDSGCVVAGITNQNNRQIWCVTRLNKMGTVLWSSKYDFSAGNVRPRKIKQTLDGGYIAVGEMADSTLVPYTAILKLDASGNVMWSHKYRIRNTTMPTREMDLIQTADGGYSFLSAYYNTSTAGDVRLIHVDAQGTLLWAKSYGGPQFDSPLGLVQLPTGGYAVAMKYNDYVNTLVYPGVLLLMTDSLGNYVSEDWRFCLDDIRIMGLNQTSNGQFMLSGMIYIQANVSGDYTAAISMRYDTNGVLQHIRMYSDPDFEEMFSTCPTRDGGQMVAGEVLTPNPNILFLLKTDSLLNSGCNEHDTLYPLLVHVPSIFSGTPNDTMIFQTTTVLVQQLPFVNTLSTSCAPLLVQEQASENRFELFPNPTSGTITLHTSSDVQPVQLEISDVFGKICWRTTCIAEQEIALPSQLSNGYYTVRVTTPMETTIQKIIIRR